MAFLGAIGPFLSIASTGFRIIGAMQQASYQRAVYKRQAELNRINAEISEQNRSRLVESYGARAQRVGDEAAKIFARNEIQRSASGFAMTSPSFQSARQANRDRLDQNLGALGAEYEAQDASLANQRYGHQAQAAANEGAASYIGAQQPFILLGGLAGIGSELNTILGNPNAGSQGAFTPRRPTWGYM